MTTATETAGQAPVLRIEGELTIYRVGELKQALLAEPPPVEIDLSGVTDIDSAGVQLLVLAKKTAQASQRELRLVAHSPAVTEVFELLNLSPYFDDPVVLSNRPVRGTSAQTQRNKAQP